MKNLTLLLAVLFTVSTTTFAASPTASPSATASPSKINQIDDLKERLATKVAELRTSQKKAITGTIKTVTVSTVTVETKTNEVKLELTDDITVIQIIKGKRTTLSTDDLAKGDVVVVFGDFDATLDLLKAKIFFIQSSLPERISGTVTALDKEEFTVTISSGDGKSSIVDIEKNSIIYSYTKSGGIVKSGFSKLASGETVHIVGTPNAKINNRYSALRILNIGNLNGATPTPSPEPTQTASASGIPKTTSSPTPAQ